MSVFSNFDDRIKKINSIINKSSFIIPEILRAAFSSKRGRNILFSVKPQWEKHIRKGFVPTRHKLEFSQFSEEKIRRSDLIVPLTMSDLRYLDQKRHLIENNPIPIPSLEAVNICDDKYLFNQTLKRNGFEQYIPKIGTDLSYPYILKKKVAEDSENCYIISDSEQEAQRMDLICSPEYFCQEIVQGTCEFATHILFKNQIVSSINIRYDFSGKTSIKGQDKIISKSICECPHLDLFASILESIGYQGLCCFNYKEVNGKPLIFEINPRFGGSLCNFFFSFVNRLD